MDPLVCVKNTKKNMALKKQVNMEDFFLEKELKINEASEIFYELPLSESQLQLSQQKVDEALKALKALQSVKDSIENE